MALSLFSFLFLNVFSPISRDKRKAFSKLKLWLLSENSLKLILIKDARLGSINEALFLVNSFSLSEVRTVSVRGKWFKSIYKKTTRREN